LEIRDVGDGSGTVRLPEAEHLRNHVGSQHAGALFSAGESASGAAVVGTFFAEMGSVIALVRTATIRFAKLASGPITATARIHDPAAARHALEADGRSEFDVDVELTNAEGNKVAGMTVRWTVRKRS